jgi:hypothetical protein
MRRLLREPLLHFLAGGALLFALYGIVGDDPSYAPDRIVVDEERVASLASTFQRTWLRPPTRGELDGLVREFVNEEILYREGLALGLDRDDGVIRRRLRHKMEFLHTGRAEREKPNDAELAAFLSANRERFQERERLSLRHVFVSPQAGTSAARRRANELLWKLRAGESSAETGGDSTLLPETLVKASEREIAAVFGAGFAGDVLALAGDDWAGPVASTYGLHLVRIDERVPTRLPELAEVRQQVEHEYEAAERAESKQGFLRELRARYDVEIQMPPALQPTSQGR